MSYLANIEMSGTTFASNIPLFETKNKVFEFDYQTLNAFDVRK